MLFVDAFSHSYINSQDTPFLATQDISQIIKGYGEHDAETIINNCNTQVVFRINDHKNAKIASDNLGEQQILKKTQSDQMSPKTMGDRHTLQEQDKKEQIVLPTEIMSLEKFQFYLNLKGIGTTKTEIAANLYKEFPDRCAEYEKKHFEIKIKDESKGKNVNGELKRIKKNVEGGKKEIKIQDRIRRLREDQAQKQKNLPLP